MNKLRRLQPVLAENLLFFKNISSLPLNLLVFETLPRQRSEDKDEYQYEFFRTEHAHKVWRPTYFEVHVLRTESSYS